MTSSFSNLVGTERDRIPDLPISNYASTEANMEEAVNKQIDENIRDQERFFKELGDIEELKANNFFVICSLLLQFTHIATQHVSFVYLKGFFRQMKGKKVMTN